jgi:hypothetical protein
MSALSIVADWRRCVANLMPQRHAHQTHALADFSFAVALAGDCRAGRVSPHVPTEARPASSRRRFERLLDNPRLRPRQAQRELARSLLAHWTGTTVLLILDETPHANDLRAMCVRVAYAGRALPLAWACYRPDEPPQPLPQLVRGLLRQVRGCLPQGCEVVLLADRGLAWPVVIDFCQQSGWGYVLRLQRHIKIRLPDGTERAAGQLVRRAGQRWYGEAAAMRAAGWRGAGVVAVWEAGMTEPWVLLVDEPGRLRHARLYAKRMWVEQSFRDDKSGAFEWGESAVTDPVHASRLLLVLALAMIQGASVGSASVRSGRRKHLDPRRGRRISVVQIGLRWLRTVVLHGLHQALRLARLYLYPR